jgi:hypothetical protein
VTRQVEAVDIVTCRSKVSCCIFKDARVTAETMDAKDSSITFDGRWAVHRVQSSTWRVEKTQTRQHLLDLKIRRNDIVDAIYFMPVTLKNRA